eukprot:COSAG01_NODE_59180_length_301_cov_4.757426_1_plen_41_part_00
MARLAAAQHATEVLRAHVEAEHARLGMAARELEPGGRDEL